MGQPQKVYLDSNAIIRFVETEEEQMTALVMRAAEGGAHLVTSELSLSEGLVAPLRDGDTVLAKHYEDLIRTDDLLTVVPVDRAVLLHSAALRAGIGGKGPDAIHAARAALMGCGIVVSLDKRLRLPQGIKRVDVEQAYRIGEPE